MMTRRFYYGAWFIAMLLLSSCGDEFYQADTRDMRETRDTPVIARSGPLREWDVAKLLVDAGFKAGEIHPMICIAKHESGLRPDAIGLATHGRARGSRDIGIFQINAFYWARRQNNGGCGISEQQLFDPLHNAKCARIVFERHGFNGWVAYKKHRAICQNYIADLRNPNREG